MTITKNILLGTFGALTLTLSPLAFTSEALAQTGYSGPSKQGGYNGPGPEVVTIEEVQKLPDNTWITMRGKIVNHLGDDKYTFQDETGQFTVEIDEDAWVGQSIGADDVVEVVGEVDKDWGRVEIDIEKIRKAM